jgi:hypothetical protein
MLLYTRACLVHVVIMVLSEIGTLASVEKTWLLLFPCVDSEGEAQVNARMEVGHVVIQIRLADLGVGGEDVHDREQRSMALRPLVGPSRMG